MLSVATFIALQVFGEQLCEFKAGTIGAGFICSVVYIWVLTAINNLESIVFNTSTPARFFPECELCTGLPQRKRAKLFLVLVVQLIVLVVVV